MQTHTNAVFTQAPSQTEPHRFGLTSAALLRRVEPSHNQDGPDPE